MARLSKEAERKINAIIRMASAQAHAALGKLYGLARKINVLVKKELKEDYVVDKAKLRQASSEANSMWLKCATIYNRVYKEGARGLEVHAALKDIRRSAANLNSLVDNPYVISPDIEQLISVIDTIEGMVAKTGHIDPISPSAPKPTPKPDKIEIPSSLKYVIGQLSSVVDDVNMPDEVKNLARAFLGRIISATKAGGNDYYELTANNSAEAKGMLTSVMQAMRRYEGGV